MRFDKKLARGEFCCYLWLVRPSKRKCLGEKWDSHIEQKSGYPTSLLDTAVSKASQIPRSVTLINLWLMSQKTTTVRSTLREMYVCNNNANFVATVTSASFLLIKLTKKIYSGIERNTYRKAYSFAHFSPFRLPLCLKWVGHHTPTESPPYRKTECRRLPLLKPPENENNYFM